MLPFKAAFFCLLEILVKGDYNIRSEAKYSKHWKCCHISMKRRKKPYGFFLCFCLLVRCPKPHRLRRRKRKDGVCTMANRERTIMLRVMVTEEEANMIKDKMLQVGTSNFSLYARKMLIDGYVIKRDFVELKFLTKELANLARSINQIAFRANETRNIYEQDVKDLQRYYGEVKSKVSEYLVKMIRE